MDFERIYAGLPWMIQNLAVTIEGFRIRHSRYNRGDFLNLLEKAESRTFMYPDEACAYRERRLREFVEHCYSTVPYYGLMFRNLGLKPGDIKTLEDLRQLPVLTKTDIQDNYSNLVSRAVPAGEQVIGHTSGTTGSGLRFATTRQSIQEQWAVWWRYRKWHGIELGTWCGFFGGRTIVPLSQDEPPFWRYNVPGRQILFSGYHMNARNLNSYVDALRRRRPPWLHGYPSTLALLAGFMLDNQMDLGYQVQWVTVGAENLSPHQATLVEKAFGVQPRQHYGMAEAAANISECPLGNLHVDEDLSAVEFIPNPAGKGWKVIGTNFTNPATPMLRYDLQDMVTLTESTCPCGRPGRLVDSIDGRAEDYVVLENGARLGRMDHIFKDMVNVREAQIVQQAIGKITIRIVRSHRYSASDEASLRAEVVKRTGKECDVAIEYVDVLERSKQGKLRFVVSELAIGKLQE